SNTNYSVFPIGDFGHLPNFFLSPPFVSKAATPMPAPNFYRLLDYVEVPSRFVGTQTFVPPNNPQVLANAPIAGIPQSLHAAFNRVSQFRNPGKVNINTIFDPFVWQGIMDERIPATGLGTPTDPVTGGPAAWLNLYQMLWNSRNIPIPLSNGYVLPLAL